MTGLIAHEWIERAGGSENVFEAIAALYPDAELITPWNNAPERFPNRHVRELWLARSPIRNHKALAVPFLASAWRTAIPADVGYDWVLASAHLFAHHVLPRGLSADVPRLAYVHTPARYLWAPDLDERGGGAMVRLVARSLRPLDRRRARELTAIAANSANVRDRIRDAWDREATVIHPPVEVESIQSVPDWREHLDVAEERIIASLPSGFILGASRFIPYKRLELVIAAADRLGRPAVIAGSGPESTHLAELARAARVPVVVVESPSTPLLYALYQQAAVFVFPPIEDFGIMPVEAIATGTPVVAANRGGSLETVREGVTGAHFSEPTPEAVAESVGAALALKPFDPVAEAAPFSRSQFDRRFTAWVAANAGVTSTGR